ncbi:hypothetical protein T09_10654 [Trichinella sp. T9]|nr:hypothetical protein T09_10654 [Trichinella sp. T9]
MREEISQFWIFVTHPLLQTFQQLAPSFQRILTNFGYQIRRQSPLQPSVQQILLFFTSISSVLFGLDTIPHRGQNRPLCRTTATDVDKIHLLVNMLATKHRHISLSRSWQLKVDNTVDGHLGGRKSGHFCRRFLQKIATNPVLVQKQPNAVFQADEGEKSGQHVAASERSKKSRRLHLVQSQASFVLNCGRLSVSVYVPNHWATTACDANDVHFGKLLKISLLSHLLLPPNMSHLSHRIFDRSSTNHDTVSNDA